MRSIMLSAVLAAGLGLAGSVGATAAPASNGTTAMPESSIVHQVQHWRWGSRRHYRGPSRGWRSCHVRRWSRMTRC
jgi:hypothetical protein